MATLNGNIFSGIMHPSTFNALQKKLIEGFRDASLSNKEGQIQAARGLIELESYRLTALHHGGGAAFNELTLKVN